MSIPLVDRAIDGSKTNKRSVLIWAKMLVIWLLATSSQYLSLMRFIGYRTPITLIVSKSTHPTGSKVKGICPRLTSLRSRKYPYRWSSPQRTPTVFMIRPCRLLKPLVTMSLTSLRLRGLATIGSPGTTLTGSLTSSSLNYLTRLSRLSHATKRMAAMSQRRSRSTTWTGWKTGIWWWAVPQLSSPPPSSPLLSYTPSE